MIDIENKNKIILPHISSKSFYSLLNFTLDEYKNKLFNFKITANLTSSMSISIGLF